MTEDPSYALFGDMPHEEVLCCGGELDGFKVLRMAPAADIIVFTKPGAEKPLDFGMEAGPELVTYKRHRLTEHRSIWVPNIWDDGDIQVLVAERFNP